tara:strand:+ start:1144 stop:1443 length:300 start_codon:yes stop_codon:yes gene_type:complete
MNGLNMLNYGLAVILLKLPFYLKKRGVIMAFDRYDSIDSLDIQENVAKDLMNINNNLFVKLGNGYFEEEEERWLKEIYTRLAEIQKNIIEHIYNERESL